MDLKSLRQDIDIIDKQILQLFQERMKKSAEILQKKAHDNLPIENREREKELLVNIDKLSINELKEYNHQLFKTIILLSKQYQETLRNNI